MRASERATAQKRATIELHYRDFAIRWETAMMMTMTAMAMATGDRYEIDR